MLAQTMIDRMIGLMGKENMNGFDGLLIKPCNSIHTFFMRFPIDVIFLTKEFKVVKVVENLKPWRMTGIYFSSAQVLELEGGTLKGRVAPGNILEVHGV